MYGTRMMENKILNVLSGVWALWDAQGLRYRILKLSWFWSQKFEKVPNSENFHLLFSKI